MFAQFAQVSDLFQEITASCHRLFRYAYAPYRPEPHYMRGPGPKWHAKHGSWPHSSAAP
jgi:hypothetical protein